MVRVLGRLWEWKAVHSWKIWKGTWSGLTGHSSGRAADLQSPWRPSGNSSSYTPLSPHLYSGGAASDPELPSTIPASIALASIS